MILGVLLLLAMPSPAEVFTLWPFGKSGGGGGGAGELSRALSPLELWTESITINGIPGGLSMALVETDLKTSFDLLTRLYPNGKFRWNGNSVLVEVKNNDGSRLRLYLIDLGGTQYPCIQFTMELPARMPENFIWPNELPLPADATPLTSINFPERKAMYGHFSTSLRADQAVSDLGSQLQADGWKSVTGEHRSGRADIKGDVFIKKQPLGIVVIDFTELENGTSKGSIYRRILK